MFMALTNSLVVLFIAVLLRYFEETFTAMLLVFHCCGYAWAIVRWAFIGPLVLLWFIVVVIPGQLSGERL